MYIAVKTHIQHCIICQLYDGERIPQTFKHPELPLRLTQWDLDFVRPIKTATTGEEYILVACERRSRFLILQATVSADAATTTEFLYQQIAMIFEPLRVLYIDQGRHFQNVLVARLTNFL